jgi:hypothetical protein
MASNAATIEVNTPNASEPACIPRVGTSHAHCDKSIAASEGECRQSRSSARAQQGTVDASARLIETIGTLRQRNCLHQ